MRITTFKNLQKIAERIRDDLNNHEFVLLFAYNGTGKTRLSVEFKEVAKRKGTSDTLYFNAYTEDLFHWDNDLENDSERVLKINSDSKFFSGFKELALEEKIFNYLERYADFDFKIDYDKWEISFSRNVRIKLFDDRGVDKESVKRVDNIKISRGEENIFIWCIYMALCELAIEGEEGGAYDWVKKLYIDDPISSLDDNNAIAVASDLAKLLVKGKGKVATVISSHHGLFFNVIFNELNRVYKVKNKRYFLHRGKDSDVYTLRATNDTPFFHHVAMLSELKQAVESEKIFTYHFNTLRSIMEKTATFFGYDDFSACIHGIEDNVLFERTLNLLSHGKYSAFEPVEMIEDTKDLFVKVMEAFLSKYEFKLPEILTSEITE